MQKVVLFITLIVIISACTNINNKTQSNSENNIPDINQNTQYNSREYKNEENNHNTKEGERPPEIIDSCGVNKEIFTISPLNLEDFTEITPLGNLAPSGHVYPTMHLYFTIRKINPQEYRSLPAEVPVYAPSDIIISEVSFIHTKSKSDFDDYAINFWACKEFKSYFDHLKTVDQKIKDAFYKSIDGDCKQYTLHYGGSVGDVDWEFCKKNVNVKIKKGELIGTAGGGEGQKKFDFGAFDFRIKQNLANQERWNKGYAEGKLPYVVCPLNYFSTQLSSQLKNKLGKNEIKRTIEPICGTVIQDVTGTAQGIWVPEGLEMVGEENEMIALVHDNLDPRIPVFSIGVKIPGINFGAYSFNIRKDGFVNRDFSEVKPSEIYCYENLKNDMTNNLNKILLIKLKDENTLLIESLNQEKCLNFKFNSPVVYVR